MAQLLKVVLMMTINIDPAGLKQTKWHEYALRFIAGGITTVVAGLISRKWGPGIGGLFLAFPAIFPASATLIEKHERQRKQEKGLHGRERGKDAAAVDALGAAMGSVGLVAFGGNLLVGDPALSCTPGPRWRNRCVAAGLIFHLDRSTKALAVILNG
jgi:hypothetical protein